MRSGMNETPQISYQQLPPCGECGIPTQTTDEKGQPFCLDCMIESARQELWQTEDEWNKQD